MFTTVSVTLPATTLVALLERSIDAGSAENLSSVIAAAVDVWLTEHPSSKQPPQTSQPPQSLQISQSPQPSQPLHSPRTPHPPQSSSSTSAAASDQAGPYGYQWKTLFLPHGTVLRSWSYGEPRYARVEGDRIIHDGRAVSPNQFARSFARTTRNAWTDLFVRLPGEKHFQLASVLRRQIAQALTLQDARLQAAEPTNPPQDQTPRPESSAASPTPLVSATPAPPVEALAVTPTAGVAPV